MHNTFCLHRYPRMEHTRRMGGCLFVGRAVAYGGFRCALSGCPSRARDRDIRATALKTMAGTLELNLLFDNHPLFDTAMAAKVSSVSSVLAYIFLTSFNNSSAQTRSRRLDLERQRLEKL